METKEERLARLYPEGVEADWRSNTRHISKVIERIAYKAGYIKITVPFIISEMDLGDCFISKHLRTSTELMGPNKEEIDRSILKELLHIYITDEIRQPDNQKAILNYFIDNKDAIHRLAILWKYDQNEK